MKKSLKQHTRKTKHRKKGEENMLNIEKYKNELKNNTKNTFFCFVYDLRSGDRMCPGSESCLDCIKDSIDWLCDEYIEDWSKVEVDTPIFVSKDGERWIKRHFAKYEEGNVYVFINGCTSWSAESWENDICVWAFSKLVTDKIAEAGR